MNNPLNDVVSNQYSKWIYPEPIWDLESWLKNNWQWFDPSHAYPIFWPNEDCRHDLDILIAGCGTNQAAIIAHTNSDARVVAIDVSQSSLDHNLYLKNKYGMQNLELYLLPIENINELNGQYDLIISTGVLHHLSDPQKGLDSLTRCLKERGVIALMLYAKYGRIGVQMLQSIAKDLGLEQNEASVLTLKSILNVLPQNHPLKSYINIAPDLEYEAGLVDTFLHGREETYSVQDCINLVLSSGLVFQDMFIKSPYYYPDHIKNNFYSVLSTLSKEKQWSIMERINFSNGCHFFTACHKERPQETYKIDFSKSNYLNYAPQFRYRCYLDGNIIYRHNWSMQLNPIETSIIKRVDGIITVSKIISDIYQNNNIENKTIDELGESVRVLMQRLWNLDFLLMRIPPLVDKNYIRSSY